MKPKPAPKYWFPAKRYGTGWGLPCAWQGWVVLLVYVAVALFAAIRLRPAYPLYFIITVVLASLVFVLLCYLKGEPTRWSWGDKDRR